MTTDLICLVLNALWGIALVQLEVTGKTRAVGVAWNMGNRDGKHPEFPDWVKRAGRALENHKENFPFFLTAVLVVHVTGHADRTSALASIVYVVARALHAIIYIAGIPRFRTPVFIIGALASLVVLSRLVA